ncbi:MAG: rod shape-determining protein MreC [Actinomycetota bacterium]|nr:rod shape-determining protein MreC [Actinomycetota bacterium]
MFDRTRRIRLLLAVLFTASILVITLDFRSDGNFLDAIGRGAMTVVGPLQEGARTVFRPVGNFFAGFTRVGSLKARIAGLQQENQLLVQREEQVSDIQRENGSLRKLVGLRERLRLKTLTARVVGVGPSNFEDSVFLDRGSADGIRKDMPVLAGDGLVGRIIQVGRHTSRVTLLIDASASVAARIARSGEIGVVDGAGERELRFELIDPEANVERGDRVVTSGYDNSVYPPGIPIGTVARLAPPSQSLSRLVYVTPFVDFTALDFLLVVTGPQK